MVIEYKMLRSGYDQKVQSSGFMTSQTCNLGESLKTPSTSASVFTQMGSIKSASFEKKLRGLKTHGRQGLHTVGSDPLSNDSIMNLVYTLRVTAMNACPRRTLRYVYFLLV